MPKISLVIPVYNAASYIEACLASLIEQNADDIEIILVDDHGSDDSMSLARNYVEKRRSRKQFRFLATPQNMGPGPARNVGIEAALGEYIGFVDSDDVVNPDFCDQLYAVAKANDADLAYCQALLEKGAEHQLLANPVIDNGAFEGANRSFFLTHYSTLFVSFIYRKELLDKYEIRFPSTRSAEDSYFLACSLLVAQRIACIDKPLYHYLTHEESLSESCNPKRYIDKVKSFDFLMQFAKNKGVYEATKAEIDYIYLKKGYLLGILTYIYNDASPQQLTLQQLYAHMLSNVPDYKNNTYYRADTRLRMLHMIVRCFPRLAFKALPYYIRKTKMKL